MSNPTEPGNWAGEGGNAVVLAERLAAMAEGLPDDERAAIRDRLAGAGLSSIGPAPQAVPPISQSWIVPPESSGILRKALSLDENTALDGPRLSELALTLASFANSLDAVAWSTWKRVAPRSKVRRENPVGQLIGQYASGELDDAEPVSREIERLRQLVAALLSAMSQVGYLAYKEVDHLSPELIESSVGERNAKACWGRFRELVGAFDEDEVEASLLKGVAEYAEGMLGDLKS